jgi:primosomal protein N' (replication factor Y)
VGVFIQSREATLADPQKLKRVIDVLDHQSLIEPALLTLLRWVADYYLIPTGDALMMGLARNERKGKPSWTAPLNALKAVASLEDARIALARAPQQLRALELIGNKIRTLKDIESQGISKATLKALTQTSFVEKVVNDATHHTEKGYTPPLTPDQADIANSVADSLSSFTTHLIDGVTGSGKTAIYIECIKRVIDTGQQVLVLVPEIGLTPQTRSRFESALGLQVPVIHSGVSDTERSRAWAMARSGAAPVILGTRSSVFCSFKSLGLIIVDEEHDSSLKQQDHPRYSARDVAVKRGQVCNCPVVLGSATPSLETLANALNHRYHHHRLTERAAAAKLPDIKLVDTRGLALTAGLSDEAIGAIETTIARGEQVLLFLNKRGFARSIQCEDCGWVAECHNCDSIMAVHKSPPQLRCHHCLAHRPTPRSCGSCNSVRLTSRGVGTEQLETFLSRKMRQTPLFRVDSDSVPSLTALNALLDNIRQTPSAILLGTQMLSKGHHFPRVTCVVIVDSDGLLFSADFRAEERLLQLLTQVSGRAGRAELPGQVLIQTRSPDHPLIKHAATTPYLALARTLLDQRRALGLPPHGALGVIRADAKQERDAIEFLNQTREVLADDASCRLLGPMPALMTRRAGLFRYHIVVHSQSRKMVHQTLKKAINVGSNLKIGRKISWFVEIDPTEIV